MFEKKIAILSFITTDQMEKREDDRIHVCVVDDHQIVVDGLRLLLESADDIEFTFSANTAAEALSLLLQFEPDLMLLDIELPDTDGIALCKILKERFPKLHVIALTMYSEFNMIKRMIEAGAQGYLLKNVGREELLSAIKRVQTGKTYFNTEIAEVLVHGERAEHLKTSSLPSLSGREKEIVRLIMEELTSPEIAQKLNISLNTVETHRRNIMHKLSTKNTAGIVRIVLENGLLD